MRERPKLTMRNSRLSAPVLSTAASLLLGMLIILPTGENPFVVYGHWFKAGFSCQAAGARCALLTTLQYATPLTLSGLSALVAFRSGLISIGQFGQMVMGAGFTTWVAVSLPWPAFPRILLACIAGLVAGALWGFIPGLLKAYLNINEVIVTLILNPLALAATGRVGFMRIPEGARLAPLVPTTKLTFAFLLAIGIAAMLSLFLWRMGGGMALRLSGRAPRFALYAGIRPRRAVVWGMALSGMLAGLAGSLEVLGVHYRFVSNFSSLDQFDGIAVSLLGQLHPIGVLFSAFLLGGLRLGAINGIQLQTGVPRELGSAVIALMMLLVTAPHLTTLAQWPWRFAVPRDQADL
jgi:ABC-type uncharacterized transport system permease subunit